MTKSKKYIYSVYLANKFMSLGYRCYETGINPSSGNLYWVFDYKEVQPYYRNKKNITKIN